MWWECWGACVCILKRLVFIFPRFTVCTQDSSSSTSSLQRISRPCTGSSECREWWVAHPFISNWKLCLLAFALALSTVSHDFVKAKCVGLFFFFYFDSVTPALTLCQLQTPHSVTPDKINWAKLEAESSSLSLPSHHLETTHLGNVFDLRSLSQGIWICLIVASGSRTLPETST